MVLVSFLMSGSARKNNLLGGFFFHVLSEVYKDGQNLVNAITHTKVHTNQRIFDQTALKMAEIKHTYSIGDVCYTTN